MSKALSDFLSKEVKARGISERELSRRAGLSVMAVNRIIRNPESTPVVETCIGLAQALDLPASLLLQLAGYSSTDLSEETHPDVAAFAAYLNQLPAKARELTLEICWSVSRIVVHTLDEQSLEK